MSIFDESENLEEFTVNPLEKTPANIHQPTAEELSIAGELASLKEMMGEFRTQIEEFEKERSSIVVDMEKIQQQLRELRQKDDAIKAKQFDIKREMRRVERDAEQKERQLKQAQENRLLAVEFEQTRKEFEEITRGAPWREWAMDHQIEGGKILANACRSVDKVSGAILGDKRGLGKTLTSIITADMLQAKKIIYFSPGDVLKTVEREIQHWAPHRTVAPLGMMPKKQRRQMLDMLRRLDSFIITINYEAWRKDMSLLEDLASLRIDTVILDEAHNIKEKKSLAFRGVEKVVFATNQCPECKGGPVEMEGSKNYSWLIVPTCRNCGHQADKSQAYEWCSVKNVLPMTGTPILNKPQDLFTLLSLIDRDNFYNEYNFLRDYCNQDLYTGKWKFASGGLDRLIKKMSSKFLVRDRHSAGVVLPPQHEVIYDLTLTPEEYPEQWRYAKMLNEHAAILLDEDKAINILYVIALITRKRQMMTWPEGIKWVDQKTKEVLFKVDCQESIKVDRVIKYVNSDIDEWQGLIPELTANGNMEEGERVVLFSQFKEPLKEIERRCKEAGISVVRYDGDTTKQIQDQVVVDFDRKYCNQPGYEKKWQVVLAHYKKGGVGLNFTDATQMIILDEEWNPGKVDQAYGRIDRMGQTEETTVHVLRVSNSIDTWMASIISEKKEMIDGFEAQHNLAQEMLDAIRRGDMI